MPHAKPQFAKKNKWEEKKTRIENIKILSLSALKILFILLKFPQGEINMNPGKAPIDPMKEGHPEPFPEPRTIPTGWDLSEFLDQANEDDPDANGCGCGPDKDGKDFSV
jgi:hypothetical protein